MQSAYNSDVHALVCLDHRAVKTWIPTFKNQIKMHWTAGRYSGGLAWTQGNFWELIRGSENELGELNPTNHRQFNNCLRWHCGWESRSAGHLSDHMAPRCWQKAITGYPARWDRIACQDSPLWMTWSLGAWSVLAFRPQRSSWNLWGQTAWARWLNLHPLARREMSHFERNRRRHLGRFLF